MILNMREDLSEILYYDIPDNPVFIRNNFIPGEVDLSMVESLHWHDEVELIYVYEGSAWYQVNEDHILMKKGEGIFVNARQLHVIYSNHADTRLYCQIFHPTLLSVSHHIAKKYIEPVINAKNMPYIKLSEEISWQKEILDSMERINEAYENEQEDLTVLSQLFHLWKQIYDNLPQEDRKKLPENTDLTVIKAMLSFIQENFSKKLSLQDICDAGTVGKTKASQLFARYLNTSPIDYLNNYRIEKSKEYLADTHKTITEIAIDTGFPDSSYFSRIFRKKTCISPTFYRQCARSHNEEEEEHES